MAIPNVLTRDQGTSKLGQGPSSATALVEVERYTEPLMPVAAFDPPRVVAAGLLSRGGSLVNAR